MYCIHYREPVTLVDISMYLDVEKPTISRTVRRLEEQRLVEAVKSEDKRERRIRLTKTGKERFLEGQEIVARFETALTEGINEEDLNRALETIQLLNHRLKQEEKD